MPHEADQAPTIHAEPAGMGSTSPSALSFNVSRMTCASCASRVERALLKVPGVESALVNLAAEDAVVRLSTPVRTADLIQAAARVGYKLTPSSADVGPPAQERSNLGPLRRKVVISAVLTLPLVVLHFAQPVSGWIEGNHSAIAWVGLVLSTPVQFWVAVHQVGDR